MASFIFAIALFVVAISSFSAGVQEIQAGNRPGSLGPNIRVILMVLLLSIGSVVGALVLLVWRWS